MNDEKVSQCVAYYRKLLDAQPKTPELLEQATRSGLQQIIHRAGAKRRTDALLARLDEAFAEKGIVTHPRLTDPENRPDEPIHMFDRRRQLKGLSKLTHQSFPDENSLRQFILANLHEFDELRGLTVVEKERRQTSGRRFDLLCKRPRRNQLVAIELKLKAADYRTVGQSLQYIDDLAAEAERQGNSPHYILIAGGQPSPAARDRIQDYAKAHGVSVTFLLHSVEMQLRKHP